MYSFNCCRTCLKATDLNPIFKSPSNSEEYTNIVYAATGIKVVINDNLPQVMCTSCIQFINISSKFRRKCQQAHIRLLNDLQQNQFNVKYEETCKTEINSRIILELSDVDSNYDYEDEIGLDILRSTPNNKTIDIDKDIESYMEFKKDENIEYRTELKPIKSNRKLTLNKNIKKVRRKTKTENEVKEKNKRVKEEIECEYCHKILTSHLSLRNHYKIHTGFEIVCEHCGKKFITRRLLLMHCKAKHGYEKTDKCSYCDYRGCNAEQIHERTHTGEKPYVCQQCDASFHRNSTYLQHLATHLTEKNIQCDQCPARFKSVTLMRIHKSKHRPSPYTFICLLCNGSFTRRRNATRHLCKTHGNSQNENIKRVKRTIDSE